MGFTLPKLPKINPFSSNAESTASGLLFPSRKQRLKRQPSDIAPPEWVEEIEGYHIASCRRHYAVGFGGCLVVGYHPNDFGSSEDMGFVKIYALDDKDDSPSWMEKPFCRMKEIWKEIHEDKKTHSVTYEMTEDGRVYSDMMGFPTDYNIGDAVYDISQMYDNWKDFPNAPDWDTVGKLHEAQQAVDQMRYETKHGWAQKNIENMRQKIKETQEEIARVEKNLNEMYEKAADGMNLLEQYGVKVNLEEDPDESRKETDTLLSESNFSIADESNVQLNFTGEATIMRNASGGYLVELDNKRYIPRVGDIVVDKHNGLSAVYSMAGKWETCE
jgi:transcriptional regulator